jgi:hypothetical protein
VGHNGVQLGLKFSLKLQLDFYVFFGILPSLFSPRCQFFLKKKVNLRNNLEMVYHSNNVRWFFTFANRSNSAMKNTLTRKPTSVKKWRGR